MPRECALPRPWITALRGPGAEWPDRIGSVQIRRERSGLAVDLSRSWSSECFVKVVLAKLRLNCRLREANPRSSATANYSLAMELTNGAMIQSKLPQCQPIHFKCACNRNFVMFIINNKTLPHFLAGNNYFPWLPGKNMPFMKVLLCACLNLK